MYLLELGICEFVLASFVRFKLERDLELFEKPQNAMGARDFQPACEYVLGRALL